jgi:transcriptional regulator with XRE-family HTH domain
MTIDTPFGALVRHRRVVLGMSQAGLADLVGRSASAVRSWERGSSTPTDDGVVRSLAAVLGLDESELRTAVGLPADGVAEESEEIGGRGLVAFSAEAALEDHTAEPAAGEISWDAVAETVRGEVKPRSPAGLREAEVPGFDDSQDEHPAAKTAGAEPEVSPPGAEIEVGGDEPVVADKEPDRVAAESRPIPILATSRARPETTGAILTPAASRTTVMPVAEPAAPPVADSYLDDPDQMMTYWIRAALTVAFALFLVIVLFWALGNLGDSIGEVWDLFKAAS